MIRKWRRERLTSEALTSGSGPLRTCVGCGKRRPQAELLRIAAPKGGPPMLDSEKRGAGRGAYVCRNQACIDRSLARHGFERTLKLEDSLPSAVREALRRAVD